jgi:hypothetical protein
MENQHEFDNQDLFKLYSVCIDQIKYFNGILWQFPTALAGVNFLALNYFYEKEPLVVCVLSIINFSLIYMLYRHWKNFNAIIDANRKIEEKLMINFPDFIPNFNRPRIKSTEMLIVIFSIANCILFFLSVIGAIHKYCYCVCH